MDRAQHSVPEPGAQHALNKHVGTKARGWGDAQSLCQSPGGGTRGEERVMGRDKSEPKRADNSNLLLLLSSLFVTG